MINCQVIHDGKVKDQAIRNDGLVFCDNHGVERYNYMKTPVVDAALTEWHYDKFGIMRQHFHGKENNSGFKVMHEVRPALLFSLAMQGFGSKTIYQTDKKDKELFYDRGYANISFVSGEGGLQVNLNRNLSLDLFSIVIPQHSIESFIEYNAQIFEPFAPFTQCRDNIHLFLNENRHVEKAVVKAANDISQARLMGNNAHRYMESKIIDCLSGFLMPGCLSSGNEYFSLLVRDKMHDVKDIILSQYKDIPSLHELAIMVGTNECTLKRAFKHEFGTSVFQFLFDYRMELAAKYLLDTSMSVANVGTLLGYDYQSHFCTAFKRKYGMSPMEFRMKYLKV